MRERNGLDRSAGPMSVRPQGEQRSDLLEGKAQIVGPLDEAKAMDVLAIVTAIPAFGP
jgi:hypothetical protein